MIEFEPSIYYLLNHSILKKLNLFKTAFSKSFNNQYLKTESTYSLNEKKKNGCQALHNNIEILLLLKTHLVGGKIEPGAIIETESC